MLRIRYCVILMLAGAYGAAQADVYRWVDEQGVPHYSDQWTPGSQVIKTGHPHPTAASGFSAPSRTPVGTVPPAQLGDQVNSQAVQQDKRAVRDIQCKAARDRYSKSIGSRRLYKEGKDGERTYLSDNDADSYREQARKDVQEFCGSVPAFDPNAAIPEPQPIPEPKVNPADATSP